MMSTIGSIGMMATTYLLSSILLLLIVSPATHYVMAQQEETTTSLQCNENNEALLRISYTISQDEWDDLNNMDVDSKLKRLTIRPSSSSSSGSSSTNNLSSSSSTTFQSIIDIVDYNTLNDLVDYTSCVSTETCYEITISEIPYDNYVIYWDDNRIDDDVENRQVYVGEYGDRITSTEVGMNCSPTCNNNDNEVLFEYKYWSNVGFEDYRIEDIITNKNNNDSNKEPVVVLRCDSYEDECQTNNMPDSLYINRVCLRSDGCYRFIVGDNFHRIP